MCVEREREISPSRVGQWRVQEEVLSRKKMLLIDYLPYLTVLKAFITLTESFHVLRDRCIRNRKWKKFRKIRKEL